VKVWGGELDREASLVNAARAFVDCLYEFGTSTRQTAQAFEQLELALELYEDDLT
jgi:hypothetical protein